jgi:hypothetical protein
MKTLKNLTGTKKVNFVTYTGYESPIFRATYVQVYKGEEQVLDSKDYKSFKMAEKWGKKKLS